MNIQQAIEKKWKRLYKSIKPLEKRLKNMSRYERVMVTSHDEVRAYAREYKKRPYVKEKIKIWDRTYALKKQKALNTKEKYNQKHVEDIRKKYREYLRRKEMER